MMVHECKVQCQSIDRTTAELMGITDVGKWLPFIFDMDMVEAAKLSDDDVDSPTYNCTTIFTRSGEHYIIDTNYVEFFKKYLEYSELDIIFRPDDHDPLDDDNLDL